jgi:hypothetical protein
VSLAELLDGLPQDVEPAELLDVELRRTVQRLDALAVREHARPGDVETLREARGQIRTLIEVLAALETRRSRAGVVQGPPNPLDALRAKRAARMARQREEDRRGTL